MVMRALHRLCFRSRSRPMLHDCFRLSQGASSFLAYTCKPYRDHSRLCERSAGTHEASENCARKNSSRRFSMLRTFNILGPFTAAAWWFPGHTLKHRPTRSAPCSANVAFRVPEALFTFLLHCAAPFTQPSHSSHGDVPSASASSKAVTAASTAVVHHDQLQEMCGVQRGTVPHVGEP